MFTKIHHILFSVTYSVPYEDFLCSQYFIKICTSLLGLPYAIYNVYVNIMLPCSTLFIKVFLAFQINSVGAKRLCIVGALLSAIACTLFGYVSNYSILSEILIFLQLKTCNHRIMGVTRKFSRVLSFAVYYRWLVSRAINALFNIF